MRRMASPKSSATERIWILEQALAFSVSGMVLVTYILSNAELSIFSMAGPERTACVQAGKDPPGPVPDEGLDTEDQRPCGVHHVVEDDDVLVPDLADDVQDLGHVGRGAPLVDDGQLGPHPLGEKPGPADTARVGRNDGQVLEIEAFEEVRQHGRGHQVVHRDGEEALDLGGVEVHGQDPVRAGFFQEIGHEPGRNGHPGAVLPILSGVAVVGHDHGDPFGRRPLEGVNHQEKLHEVEAGVRGAGLDDEDVFAPDVLVDVEVDLPVRKALEHRTAKVDLQVVDDLPGQARIG